MPVSHQRMRNMVIRNLGLAPKGSGVQLTLRQVKDGAFNPTTGTLTQVINEYTGTGVRMDFSEWHRKNFDIPYSDFQVYLSPIQLTSVGDPVLEMPNPEIDDTIVFLGKEAKVINFEAFNENGVGCGWKVHVRTS